MVQAQLFIGSGLWCDTERVQQGLQCVGIAHAHLKERRARRPVRNRAGRAVAIGGFLADYVPFYFANRSPMLYSIHRGNVVGYAGGQANVVHLVSNVEQVVSGNRSWCFTDGHAVEAITEQTIGDKPSKL
jgi:ssDNA thymidine ADP-ribosyltransferase, DarT